MVRFNTPYDVDEATQRLTAIVLESSLKFKLSYFISRYILWKRVSLADLIGHVSEEKVFLFRYRQGMGRNSFKPIFHGRFIAHNQQTYLNGSISVAMSTKIVTGLWFAWTIYFTGMVINFYQQNPVFIVLLMPIGPVLMYLLLYGVGRWVNRDDEAFMIKKIEAAINGHLID